MMFVPFVVAVVRVFMMMILIMCVCSATIVKGGLSWLDLILWVVMSVSKIGRWFEESEVTFNLTALVDYSMMVVVLTVGVISLLHGLYLASLCFLVYGAGIAYFLWFGCRVPEDDEEDVGPDEDEFLEYYGA